jgi:hypothetical protein
VRNMDSTARRSLSSSEMPERGCKVTGLCKESKEKRTKTEMDKKAHQEVLQEIKKVYPEIFTLKFGEIKDFEARINIKEGAVPVFCKSIPVPYAWSQKYINVLNEEIAGGVLKPVKFSKWATNVVPVLKANGSDLRLCGNFKLTVNQVLKT